MKDNQVLKLRKAVTETKKKAVNKIRESTGKLTQKQAVILIGIMFAAFVVVDVIYIVRGFRGHTRQVEIEHIRQIQVEPINQKNNDTESEFGTETDSGESARTDFGSGAGL